MGQISNTLAYQRQLNVLNTLIEGCDKMRDILKEPSFDLDAHDNIYLGRNSKRNSLKSRLQSQSQFSRVCIKSRCYYTVCKIRPYWEVPYPITSKEVGAECLLKEPAEVNKICHIQCPLERLEVLCSLKYSHTCNDKKLNVSKKNAQVPSSRSSPVFPRVLE